MRSNRRRTSIALLVLALVLAACGGDDDAGGAEGSEDDEPVEDATADQGRDDGPAPRDAAGRATVTHDSTTQEFVVHRCAFSTLAAGDTTTEDGSDGGAEDGLDGAVAGAAGLGLVADGVTAETPTEVVDALIGVVEAEQDVTGVVALAAMYGPTLRVERSATDGDLIAVVRADGTSELQAETSEDGAAQFLEISGSGPGATVTASAVTGDGQVLTLDLTCPAG